MAAWFYARGGQQIGPLDFAQLQSLAAQRQLTGDDLVWTEGMPDWQPASRIPGLSFAAPQPEPVKVGITPLQANFQSANPGPMDQSSLAMTALVLSLIGPFSCGSLGFGGIVCGWAALAAMRRTGDYRRRGIALAAIWIGIAELSIMLVLLLLFIIGMALGHGD